MIKENLSKVILKYWNIIKIWWLVLAIITMIIAIRTYINYATIKDAIIWVKENIEKEQEKIDYSKSFLEPYLESEYADYFQAHENNILFYGEYIIRFEAAKLEQNKNKNEKENGNIINTPQQSRIHFLKEKMQKK